MTDTLCAVQEVVLADKGKAALFLLICSLNLRDLSAACPQSSVHRGLLTAGVVCRGMPCSVAEIDLLAMPPALAGLRLVLSRSSEAAC